MTNAGRVNEIEYQKTVEVDGLDYKVHLLSPTRSIKWSVKLTKIIGEPVAGLASSGDGLSGLQNAVKSLLSRCDEGEVLELMKAMVETCTHKNKKLNFEDDFHGRVGHLLKLTSKVMEVQFGDFFDGLATVVKEAMKKIQEQE